MEPTFQVLPPGSRLPPTKRPGRGGFWGALITAGVVALKFITPLLLFLKTAGMMLLSVGAFVAMGWTWQVAIGLVVLIFVHEMGHFVAAKIFGLPVSVPMFIPFMGAYVRHGLPANNWDNAIIAYAGPLAGGLGGWACYALGLAVDFPWLYTTAFYTFILNLLNLAPIPPLDGSKIWTGFFPRWTPGMSLSDRFYLGLFLAALIAGLLLGCLECWLYWHAVAQ
jgi:Zn-dependent protease